MGEYAMKTPAEIEDEKNKAAVLYARLMDDNPVLENEAYKRSLYGCAEDCDCVRCRAFRILTARRNAKADARREKVAESWNTNIRLHANARGG
jgi:tRNA threonylcarbamoyladenosine modification (KEOPS) complex Cgi121 subunit